MPRSLGSGWVGVFAARLGCIGLLFTGALVLELREVGPYNDQQLDALYGLVLAGFLLSLAFAAAGLGGFDGRPLRGAEVGSDGALIATLIYCTGASGSLFGFLFVPWIVVAATRLGGHGAMYATAGAILLYGVLGPGTASRLVPSFGDVTPTPLNEALTAFGMHVAAFLSVALLARRMEGRVEHGESMLRELGELHQRIVDNVSSGLLTTDREGRITSFNQAAQEITGRSAAETLGVSLNELFPLLEEGEPGPSQRGELPLVNCAGDRLFLGFSRSILRDERGQPEGEIVIFQDLTRIHQMEEQLRRSERLSAVGQLATGLAHEVRNPLGALSGAIELLRRDLRVADVSSRRLFRIVERETERLNRLVVDFLSYAGNRTGRREPVALLELFTEIRDLLQSAETPEIHVELNVPPELEASADPDQLRQIFWNLILNAAQSHPSDGRVRVSAREAAQGKRVAIEIVDRGAGIEPEVLDRILEPFFTTKSGGTGLGLATVHRVIEDHGGELEIESQFGVGTTVRVTLEAQVSTGSCA